MPSGHGTRSCVSVVVLVNRKLLLVILHSRSPQESKSSGEDRLPSAERRISKTSMFCCQLHVSRRMCVNPYTSKMLKGRTCPGGLVGRQATAVGLFLFAVCCEQRPVCDSSSTSPAERDFHHPQTSRTRFTKTISDPLHAPQVENYRSHPTEWACLGYPGAHLLLAQHAEERRSK